MQTIHVDLRDPPENRWGLTRERQGHARELLGAHADHWAELESLALSLRVPVSDVALGNCCYDAIKLILGCTAFAVDTRASVLHACNLDWWTQSAILSRYTVCATSRRSGGPVSRVRSQELRQDVSS